jgi:hypothetical protein
MQEDGRLAQFPRQRGTLLFLNVRKGHFGALADEFSGGGGADSARRPGNERDFSCQTHISPRGRRASPGSVSIGPSLRVALVHQHKQIVLLITIMLDFFYPGNKNFAN